MNIQNEDKVKALSVFCLVVTTIIWGSSFVVMKHSVDVIAPTYLLALRFTIAAVALMIVFFSRFLLMNKKEALHGSTLGVFLFLSYLFQTYGLKHTTASKNAFITTLYVIIVPFLHWFLHRKRPSMKNIGAAVIALVGLALLSLEGDLSVNRGDLLTLFGGVFFALHIVLIDSYTEHHDPIILTVVQMIAAALLSWMIAPVLEGYQNVIAALEHQTVIGLLYLGICSTMICFLLQTIGQKHLSPNTASIVLSFEAVFGLSFSVIFLKEEMSVKLIAGCVFMFLSVIISEYQKKKPEL